MPWRSGIFTHHCFNFPKSSISSGVNCVVTVSLLGKGGMTFGSLSYFSSPSSLGGGLLSGRTFPECRLIS